MNDLRMAKDIHKKFGQRELKTFPMCGMLKYKIYYRYFKGMRREYPLDYVVYNKPEAEELLHEKYGWTKYENKHYENVFTRFLRDTIFLINLDLIHEKMLLRMKFWRER